MNNVSAVLYMAERNMFLLYIKFTETITIYSLHFAIIFMSERKISPTS